jgi:hypothetical protein
MKSCPECKAKVEKGAKSCPDCGYSMVAKAADDFTLRVEILKRSDEQRRVYGFCKVAKVNGEPVADDENDLIAIPELEDAAAEFMASSREAGTMHIAKGTGRVFESIVTTAEKYEAMGVPADIAKSLPEGWWVGAEVTDDTTWAGVKAGRYRAFSIAGTAFRKEA